MNPRAIFPTIMFLLAGAAFLFGGWQYLQAQAIAKASQKRMAFIITEVSKEKALAATDKKKLFAKIMDGLPSAPKLFAFDFSGSFASQTANDSCISEGQRAICQALRVANTDSATMVVICGTCNPQ